MTAEQWRRIREAYERIAALDATARAALLDDACGGDGEVRAIVLRMLATPGSDAALRDIVDRAAAAWLEEPSESTATPADAPPRIDRYRLDERLGEGGMGVVYAATRVDGMIRRPLALKVLRRGLDTESFVRRFAVERAALERLDHPGIARLLDAGACDDGRPYLVMELVEGLAINAWCRSRAPSLRDRLERMIEVCDAVAYAHSRLVVHRDIKPSNILVDGTGRARLLDFGIARIVDEDGSAAATRTADRVLTPRYASPELLAGAPVSTVSDIYSLGVVLFELLVGASPYTTADDGRAEYGRAVLEQTPPRASVAAESAAARGRSDALPSRVLRGDLDTIVAQAMRREPERRYRSAEALAADLRAFLDSRPIAARPESFGYELRKLVARRPWQATFVGGAACSLAALALIALLMARRASHAEAEAELALEEAKVQTAVAERYGEFLTQEFLLLLDPARSMQGTISLEEAVRRASARIEGRFPDAPLAEALIEHTFGDAFIQRTLHAEAEPHLRRAWRIRDASLGSDHPDTLVAKRDLATSLLYLDRRPEARGLLEEVLEAQLRTMGPDHGYTLMTMSILGRTLGELGENAAAERLLLAAYEGRLRVLGPRDGNTMSSMNQLGNFYMKSERLQEALPYFEEAERLRIEEYGPEHPRTLIARGNLATLRGRLGEAERAARDLRAIREAQLRVLGPGHAHTLHVLNQIVSFDRLRGDLDASIAAQHEFAEAAAATHGASSARAIESLLLLTELLAEARRSGEAAETYARARAAAEDASEMTPALQTRMDALGESLDTTADGTPAPNP